MRPPPFPALLVAALLAVGSPARAQDAAAAFDPRTGDAWVDTWLDDINRYGRTYREPFVDELVRYHAAPRELVVELLRRPGWTPGDVYFACSLAVAVGRPCRAVVDDYERDRSAGWGALARRLGVQPGSEAFHRLKRGFVPTYDRWSRPIRLDADLERAFPGRARGAPKGDRRGPEAAGPAERREPVGGEASRPDGGRGSDAAGAGARSGAVEGTPKGPAGAKERSRPERARGPGAKGGERDRGGKPGKG